MIGDFNARTASSQTNLSPLDITWEEEEHMGTYWTRNSQDTRIDGHGEALLRMCNSTQLIIANGTKRWPDSKAYTCHTATGKSVIDYLLISERATERVQGFHIKALQPESDHCPLHLHL